MGGGLREKLQKKRKMGGKIIRKKLQVQCYCLDNTNETISGTSHTTFVQALIEKSTDGAGDSRGRAGGLLTQHRTKRPMPVEVP